MIYLGDQAIGVNNVFSGKILTLNTSDARNAYVSTTVGQIATFTNSSASICYVDALQVDNEHLYLIDIFNGATVASTGKRNSVLVDNNMIVQEVYDLSTAAGQKNSIAFHPETNGSLILCVDNKYTKILVYEIVI